MGVAFTTTRGPGFCSLCGKEDTDKRATWARVSGAADPFRVMCQKCAAEIYAAAYPEALKPARELVRRRDR